MMFNPAYPFASTVVFKGQNVLALRSTGRVLSPTTLKIPLSIRPLMESALWRPVIAGGIMPLSLQRFAALKPTCLSQARLKEISLDASEYVALVKSA